MGLTVRQKMPIVALDTSFFPARAYLDKKTPFWRLFIKHDSVGHLGRVNIT